MTAAREGTTISTYLITPPAGFLKLHLSTARPRLTPKNHRIASQSQHDDEMLGELATKRAAATTETRKTSTFGSFITATTAAISFFFLSSPL
ncbi:hypothetical protein BJY04DRAFT_190525 [Aspergillus karnatakaensis]|uniref:uncharacterized protein n=1 Tax=Aspergillus karnatakaensis TaxID=1810916 RepID=UPI003CCCEF57